MDTYSKQLDRWLSHDGNSEAALALKAGCTQASVNRYRNDKRFPDIEQARRIEAATDGEVSVDCWRTDFLTRSGINTPAQSTGKAEAA